MKKNLQFKKLLGLLTFDGISFEIRGPKTNSEFGESEPECPLLSHTIIAGARFFPRRFLTDLFNR